MVPGVIDARNFVGCSMVVVCMRWVRVGPDGRTPHERMRGKRFRKEPMEFVEHVLYLVPKSQGHDTWESRWEKGIWLGIRDESMEAFIGTPSGPVTLEE